MKYSIFVGSVLNPDSEVTEGVRIDVADGQIAAMSTGCTDSDEDIKLPGAVCCAALINAHEHLKYSWPKRIAPDAPIADSYEWLPKLYREAEREFLRFIDLEDLYWLGAYKNILSGVSTVANHARRLPEDFVAQFPIRILTDFARELFVRPDARARRIGFGVEKEIALAKSENVPFVVHIAEGLNLSTSTELELLRQLGGLFDGTVLVHGVNLSTADIEKIAKNRASLVWCPASNDFLFGQTAPIKHLLEKEVNVALGTDSSSTGSPDLAHEMRIAIAALTQFTPNDLAVRLAFEFVTVNAARAYKQSKLGRVAPGFSADMLFFDTSHSDPFQGLAEMKPEQIMLLTRSGKWLLGEEPHITRIPCAASLNEQVTLFGMPRRIVGDPVGLINRVAARSSEPRSLFPLGRALGT
jgi:cytosine/adenosine deaminase-related metal-dependent hydrolase